jgi:hypothetical protein
MRSCACTHHLRQDQGLMLFLQPCWFITGADLLVCGSQDGPAMLKCLSRGGCLFQGVCLCTAAQHVLSRRRYSLCFYCSPRAVYCCFCPCRVLSDSRVSSLPRSWGLSGSWRSGSLTQVLLQLDTYSSLTPTWMCACSTFEAAWVPSSCG